VFSCGTRQGLALAATGLAPGLQFVPFAAHGGFRALQDYLQHSWLARLVLSRWPAIYAPTQEIFAGRTAHTDEPSEGPFVFEADGRCRKALAQKRHANALQERCGPEPPGASLASGRRRARRGGAGPNEPM
jgi:hypothetical protein